MESNVVRRLAHSVMERREDDISDYEACERVRLKFKNERSTEKKGPVLVRMADPYLKKSDANLKETDEIKKIKQEMGEPKINPNLNFRVGKLHYESKTSHVLLEVDPLPTANRKKFDTVANNQTYFIHVNPHEIKPHNPGGAQLYPLSKKDRQFDIKRLINRRRLNRYN